MDMAFQNGLFAILLEELHNYESFPKLVARLSEFSGMFVELIDFGGCGLSSRVELPDTISSAEYRRVKKEVIQQLFSNAYDRRPKNCAVGGYVFTAKLICWDGIPVAVGIVVYPSDGQDDEALTLLNQMEKFCRYIYGDMSLKSADANYADILSHLLFYTDPDIATLVSALLPTYKRMSAVSSPYTAVHFVPTGDRPAKPMKSACDRFGREWPSSYRVMRKNDFSAIVSGFDISSLERLSGFCAKLFLHCGCSMAFTDIAARETYIRQAKAVAELGVSLDRSMSVYRADILLPQLMAETAVRNDPSGSLVQSELLLLHKYDTDNSSEYLSTLEAYLTNGRNITDTAATLFIARSTLKYRLNKIHIMTGIDFTDNERCSTLLMGCLVYRSHMRRIRDIDNKSSV